MLEGGITDSYNDHRIAMSITIACKGMCKKDVVIKNAEAVNKSYPTFFDDFKRKVFSMSSSFGNRIKSQIFGQSHSKAIGVVIDGIPAGFEIDMDKLPGFMERRAPGRNIYSTQRRKGHA